MQLSQFTQTLTEITTPLDESRGKPLKLIIHAGTPKTGTTSLQTYLEKRQQKLRTKGILYPHNLEKIQNTDAPKHHWFEKNLITYHQENFLKNFKNILSQVKENTHTIFISSEGIYNYWWDFPDESKQILKELKTLFNVEMWVWFREPLAFIESYYKQCIRNPQVDSNPCYGKSLSFAEMLEIEWFSRHLDYQGFVTECQALFGKDTISVLKYQGDVVQEVIKKLGLATPHDNPTPRQNQSLNSASIELLKTVNRYNIKAKDKTLFVQHLKVLNKILDDYANNGTTETFIDEHSKKKVLELTRAIEF